jgi:formylglycine-generating enzyme required for sulfatase activity
MSTCPSLDQLSKLALGTLPPDSMQWVAAHVDECPACEAVFAGLEERGDLLITSLRTGGARPQPPRVAAGTVLGDYVIEGVLGAGGMGHVFRASHRRMKREVALKLVAPRMLASPEAVQRFHREVELAARLVHPNIAMAYDAREHQGTYYLILEYIDGMDLAKRVKERGPLPVELALDYVLQAARGLAYAHRQGVVHRDIKPANLIVDGEGNVKVLDLGLSRLHRDPTRTAPLADDNAGVEQQAEAPALPPETDPVVSGTLTRANAGSVLGTAAYLAPEQATNPEQAGPAADVYALGCTLFYLMTGVNPFAKDSVAQTLRAHREETAPPLSQFGIHAPRGLEAAMKRMLAKRPEDRFASMEQVVRELDRCLPRRAAGRRRKTVVAAAIVLLALGATYAVLSGRLARWLDRSGAAQARAPMTTTTTTVATAPAYASVPMTPDQALAAQANWAAYARAPVNQKNTLGMTLSLIPAGEFLPSPALKVRISRPFYMASTEVTVGQFQAFVDAARYRSRADSEGGAYEDQKGNFVMVPGLTWRTPRFAQTDAHPATQLAYEDAAAFCEWLSRKEQARYRLPTELEWEWAARAGAEVAKPWEDPDAVARGALAEQFGWMRDNSGMQSHPVAQLKPNAWGLFDMHGNAVEWCSDHFWELPPPDAPNDRPPTFLVDPTGPAFGRTRVLRGTGFHSLWNFGVLTRGHSDRQHFAFGFRVVREIGQPDSGNR